MAFFLQPEIRIKFNFGRSNFNFYPLANNKIRIITWCSHSKLKRRWLQFSNSINCVSKRSSYSTESFPLNDFESSKFFSLNEEDTNTPQIGPILLVQDYDSKSIKRKRLWVSLFIWSLLFSLIQTLILVRRVKRVRDVYFRLHF